MGLTSFEIRLDNSEQSYFCGQIVSGKVVIGLDVTKKVKGVKLKLVGKAKTSWSEHRGKSSIPISETVQYIEEKVYLFGYEENNPEVLIPQGCNEYPFYFKLPTEIPSSFESKHGYVKYYLESVISSRSLKFDHKVRNLFTVNGIMDLNFERDAGNGGELCHEKNVCCLCCTSGPIRFQLKLLRIGYVPGENIAYIVELFNFSSRTVTSVKLTLLQIVTFHAKKKMKVEKNKIRSIDGPLVEPGETEIWLGSVFQIPSLPPTRLGGCRIIDIEYFVKIEMDIPGGCGLEGKLPIIIGTIPLRNTFEELTAPSNISNGAPTPTLQLQLPDSESQMSMSYSHISTSLIPTFTEYPNLPPPTYEEAVHNYGQNMDDANSDSEPPEYGNVSEGNNFIPKYVNYRTQQTQEPLPTNSS